MKHIFKIVVIVIIVIFFMNLKDYKKIPTQTFYGGPEFSLSSENISFYKAKKDIMVVLNYKQLLQSYKLEPQIKDFIANGIFFNENQYDWKIKNDKLIFTIKEKELKRSKVYDIKSFSFNFFVDSYKNPDKDEFETIKVPIMITVE